MFSPAPAGTGVYSHPKTQFVEHNDLSMRVESHDNGVGVMVSVCKSLY
jgi:hypothetical protein